MRNFTGFYWLYLIVVLFWASPPVAVCQQFRSQQAGFVITVNGIENPHEIVTVFVLPNEQLKIEVKKIKQQINSDFILLKAKLFQRQAVIENGVRRPRRAFIN